MMSATLCRSKKHVGESVLKDCDSTSWKAFAMDFIIVITLDITAHATA